MSVKRDRTPRREPANSRTLRLFAPIRMPQHGSFKGGGQTGGVKLGLQIETLGTGFKIFPPIKLDRRWISSLWQTRLNCSHLEHNEHMNEGFTCTTAPLKQLYPNIWTFRLIILSIKFKVFLFIYSLIVLCSNSRWINTNSLWTWVSEHLVLCR